MKPGERVGPYEIEARIGRGAMGEVYRVRHVELGSRYALKVLSRHLLDNAAALQRFEIEMEGLGRVDGHPGIVRVHSAGKTSRGVPYFAMEYVEGRPLSRALKEGLGREQALDAMEQVARALGHAHRRGLVHRDVKPDNILLGDDGQARLTDFGLARLLDREQRLTRSKDLIGTPFYLAPEQAKSKLGPVGPASDVYSVGAVLYEVLCGRPPHGGQTTMEVVEKVLKAPVVPPSGRGVAVSPALEAVVLKALSRRPDERYPDGEAVAEALRSARASGPAEGAAEGAPARGARGTLRALVALALGSVLLAVATVGVLLGLRHRQAGAEVEALAQELQGVRRGLGREEPAALLERLDQLGARLQADAPGAALAGEAGALRRELGLRLARQRFVEGDVPGAAQLLPAELAAGEEFPELGALLVMAGEPRRALPSLGSLSPASRAHAAAWAGDLAACREALGAVAPERARPLSLALRSYLPELEPAPAEGAGPWVALAEVEEALAQGRPEQAALALERAGGGPDLALELGLARARLELARGRPEEAARAVEQVAEQAGDPIEEARCRCWRAVALAAAGQALPGSPVLEALERRAPGVPLAAGLLRQAGIWEAWGEPARLEAVLGPLSGRRRPGEALARARDQARQVGAAAGLQLARTLLRDPSVVPPSSFVQAELRLCSEGADGPLGLLLARAHELAEGACRGLTQAAAQRALDLLQQVAGAEAGSPGLWWVRSRVERVLRRVDDAVRSAERGLALAPGDPALLLARGEARWGALLAATPSLAAGNGWFLSGPAADLAGPLAGLAKELGPLLEAEPASPPGWGGRLLIGRTLVARRAVLTSEGAAALEEEAGRVLTPLLGGLSPQALAPLRAELVRGAGDLAAAEWEARAVAILEGARPPAGWEVACDALRLGGELGLAGWAQAYLLLVGDLPARAALLLGQVRQGGGDELELVRRARGLAPTLGQPRVLESLLRGGAEGRARGARLAELVLTTPEWAALLPWLQELTLSETPPEPGELGLLEQVLRGLANATRGSYQVSLVGGEAQSEEAQQVRRRSAQEAVFAARRVAQLHPESAGVQQLLASALGAAGEPDARTGLCDPRLIPEAEHAARAAEAGLPWSAGPFLTAWSLLPAEEPLTLADPVFLRGYCDNSPFVWSVRRIGRGEGRVSSQLSRARGGELSAREWVDLAKRLAPHLPGTSALLLLRERARVRSDELLRQLLGDGPAAASWGKQDPLELLAAAWPGEPDRQALAELWLGQGDGAVTRTLALRALAALGAAGSLPGRYRGPGLRLELSPSAPEGQHGLLRLLQPEHSLWATCFTLVDPVGAWSCWLRRRQGEPDLSPAQLDRLLLVSPQDGALQEELLPLLLAEGRLEELQLAVLRAAAFASDRNREDAAWRLGTRLRAWARAAANPERAAALRGAARLLVRAARSVEPEAVSLLGLSVDLDLDDWDGSAGPEAAAALLEQAERSSRSGALAPEPPALAWLRQGRARLLLGSAAPLPEPPRGDEGLAWARAWLAGDPHREALAPLAEALAPR